MRSLAILLLIVGMAGAALPFLSDMYLASDTLHVTSTEKGWLLGAYSGAYSLLLTNNTANTYTYRFTTDGADTVFITAGSYSSFSIPWGEPAFMMPVDSIFVDGSASFTLQVQWLEVR